MSKWLLELSWWVIVFLALAVGIRATQYIGTDPLLFEPELAERHKAHLGIVAIHATFGIASLFLGLLLLTKSVRSKSIRIHRAMGGLYLTCVAIGAVTGLHLAQRAHGGLFAQLGFSCLSLLWLYSGWKSIECIINQKYLEHQRWTLRNYGLTFTAVTFRLELFLLQYLGLSYLLAYQIVAWGSWIVNLLAVELLLVAQENRARQVSETTNQTQTASLGSATDCDVFR